MNLPLPIPDQGTVADEPIVPRTALCRIDQIVDGASRGFDPLGEGKDTMFVVRSGIDAFGYRNACPHYDYARMASRKDAFLNGDGSRILCAAHGALFRIEDGVCEIGPCIGASLAPVWMEIVDGTIWLIGDYSPGLHKNRNKSMRR